MADSASPSEQKLRAAANAVAVSLQTKGWALATAESCTGGWIGKICTDIAGSSEWYELGVIAYSNRAKESLLQVSSATLARFGAVSCETAEAMACGVIAKASQQVGVATTGIAGPGGGSDEKPVGLVCFSWVLPQQKADSESVQFAGDREAIRRQSVLYALQGLKKRLDRAQAVAKRG